MGVRLSTTSNNRDTTTADPPTPGDAKRIETATEAEPPSPTTTTTTLSSETISTDIPYSTPTTTTAAVPTKRHNTATTKTSAATAATAETTEKSTQVDSSRWLSRVKKDGLDLRLAPDHIRGDIKVVTAAVQQNGVALRFALPKLKGNKAVVIAAVQNHCFAIRHASPEILNDKEVIFLTVNINGLTLEYASPELKNDKEVVTAAVQQNGRALRYASPQLQNDKEIVLIAVRHDGRALQFASASLQNDVQVVMKAIKRDGIALKYCSPLLQNNKVVVLAAAAQNHCAIQYASQELQDDEEVRPFVHIHFLSEVQNGNWKILSIAPLYIRNDKKIMLAALRKEGSAIQFATDEIKDDKEFMLNLVQKNGNFFGYASQRLHDDEDMKAATYRYWLAQVKLDGDTNLQRAPHHIRNDEKIVITAIQHSSFGLVLRYATKELQNCKRVVMAAVKKSGTALQFASPDLRNDKDIILVAIQQDDRAYQYVPPELRKDIDVELLLGKRLLKEAVQNFFGREIGHSTPERQKVEDIVIAAMKQYSMAGKKQNASELRYARLLALAAVQIDADYIKYFHEDLKHDPEVLVVSGMFDKHHIEYKNRKADHNVKKIVFSTRYSLKADSYSEATNFTKRFKDSKYIQEKGNFVIYAPNAFDKNTCDPNWTSYDHPCRGTKETCQYNNVLTKEGHPTDDCCWRYSFRSQLEEAKKTGGFMLQLVERGEDYRDVHDWAPPTLGMGQRIELEMAASIGTKVFQVYRPTGRLDEECWFQDPHVDVVAKEIRVWCDNPCKYMTTTVIRQPFHVGDKRSNKVVLNL